ncbi:unnamed protein product [Ectocarpus sp. 4 AP-2014]
MQPFKYSRHLLERSSLDESSAIPAHLLPSISWRGALVPLSIFLPNSSSPQPATEHPHMTETSCASLRILMCPLSQDPDAQKNCCNYMYNPTLS